MICSVRWCSHFTSYTCKIMLILNGRRQFHLGNACLDWWYLPSRKVACRSAQDTSNMWKAFMMLYVFGRCFLTISFRTWLMPPRRCPDATTNVANPKYTLHIWCVYGLDDVIWHCQMLAGHDCCRHTDVVSRSPPPHLMLESLGRCHLTLADVICQKRTCNVRWVQAMTYVASQCAHTTFNVC